jgi:hypothetical protein
MGVAFIQELQLWLSPHDLEMTENHCALQESSGIDDDKAPLRRSGFRSFKFFIMRTNTGCV